MEQRLIDANALISEMQDKCCGDCDLCIYCRYENANYFCGLIEEAPTFEDRDLFNMGYFEGKKTIARPKGEWTNYEEGIFRFTKCSNCQMDYSPSLYPRNFCPNCGADMREADND